MKVDQFYKYEKNPFMMDTVKNDNVIVDSVMNIAKNTLMDTDTNNKAWS